MAPAPGLGSQCSLSWALPSTAQAAPTCRLLWSSYQWSWKEHRWQLTLACTSQEAREPVYPGTTFRPHQTITQPPPQVTHSRGRPSRHQSLIEVSPTPWSQLLHSWSFMGVMASPHNLFSWWQIPLIDLPTAIKAQLQEEGWQSPQGAGVCAPGVSSLGDGGDANGLYKTPTTSGHSTKPRRHSSSASYKETHTGRLPQWGGKYIQINP